MENWWTIPLLISMRIWEQSMKLLCNFKGSSRKNHAMAIAWERVGFVHGVMNTDNMSILGVTIDYGPYGWLEDYNPGWTPNTTDAGQARYAFGKQGYIALWNIYQLANALVPLIKDTKRLEDVLQKVQVDYRANRQKMMLAKLGLREQTDNAEALIKDLEQILYDSEMDMTLFFRNLSSFDGMVSEAFISALKDIVAPTFEIHTKKWTEWLPAYAQPSKAPEKINSAIECGNPKCLKKLYGSLGHRRSRPGRLRSDRRALCIAQKTIRTGSRKQKRFAKDPIGREDK